MQALRNKRKRKTHTKIGVLVKSRIQEVKNSEREKQNNRCINSHAGFWVSKGKPIPEWGIGRTNCSAMQKNDEVREASR